MTIELQSEILHRLRSVGVEPVWSAVLPMMASHFEAESADCYRIVGDTLDMVHWIGPYGSAFYSSLRLALRRGTPDTLAYDPFNPAPELRNRALPLEEVVQANHGRRGQFAERMRDHDYAKNDQLGVLACDGQIFLGCVGVGRPERFRAEEQRAMTRLVPAIRERLKLDLYMRNGPVFRAGLNASLDLLPGEACMVSWLPSGLRVLEANQLAQQALERDRLAFLDELEASLKGPTTQSPFRVSPLEGLGIANHFLLVRSPAPSALDETRLLAMGQHWSLTRKQSAVLARLAMGRANKAIAVELSCAEVTVEHHVTALLQKAGVASRAELIARFWSGA